MVYGGGLKQLDAKKLKKEEKERKKAEKKKHKKEKRKRETSYDSDSGMDTLNRLKKMHHKDKSHKQSMGSNSQSKMDMGLINEEDTKSRRDHLKEPTEYNANFKIPPYREHLKDSEKLQERRYDQERSRSPLNYRRHRAQSPSENGERHRSRSPSKHGKILSRRQNYRSRSPSGYGARRRSRSPSNHVQSLHHRQRHKSQSPSDYGRRHRSHSPDGWGNGVCPDHRNKFAPQQVRESNSHARGTDSWPIEKKPSAGPNIHTNPVSRPKYQAGKLSEEEKAARLSEMQMDAELHDEQRWRRLKKASEADAREAMEAARRSGKNFLDATNKSVYGAEKGGSSTIEESVRRRTHYLQGSAAATEGNAFRR
ncbi:hypothetical protein KI387_015146 [Taxus chinensis]|uniref:Uncharacterized protein n=1 Tax=Taxus chinensis TaxID=29808 RepID=A0AA38GEQ3_TAXCH|nr:hypothetical protein KI387_015146 [Taxus chinensis]